MKKPTKKEILFWHTLLPRELMDAAEKQRLSLGMSKTGAVEMMVRAFIHNAEDVRYMSMHKAGQ